MHLVLELLQVTDSPCREDRADTAYDLDDCVETLLPLPHPTHLQLVHASTPVSNHVAVKTSQAVT